MSGTQDTSPAPIGTSMVRFSWKLRRASSGSSRRYIDVTVLLLQCKELVMVQLRQQVAKVRRQCCFVVSSRREEALKPWNHAAAERLAARRHPFAETLGDEKRGAFMNAWASSTSAGTILSLARGYCPSASFTAPTNHSSQGEEPYLQSWSTHWPSSSHVVIHKLAFISIVQI